MDFQITIKQKEREAAEKAVAEATPKIRAEAESDERNRIIIRMLEAGSLSDDQIIAITGATSEELESCKRAVSKN